MTQDFIEYPKVPVHRWLIRMEGGLRPTARKMIPALREYIEDLPPTAATFRPIDAVEERDSEYTHVAPEYVELVGGWPLPDIYERSGTKRYVNPNYEHAHRYSDVIVECACGAVMNVSYDNDDTSLDVEHDHADDCKRYHRLEARAQLLREREKTLLRCVAEFGWTTREFSSRMGVERHTCWQHFGYNIDELRKPYQQRIGNTYALLTNRPDVSPEIMTDIYGLSRQTLRKYARTRTDFHYDQSEKKWKYRPGAGRSGGERADERPSSTGTAGT